MGTATVTGLATILARAANEKVITAENFNNLLTALNGIGNDLQDAAMEADIDGLPTKIVNKRLDVLTLFTDTIRAARVTG